MLVRALVVCVLLLTATAHADDRGETATGSSEPRPEHGHEAAPVHGFTYSPLGSPAGTVGAAAFDQTVLGSVDPSHRFGGRVFGSPIDRLTLLAEGHRAFSGALVPAATAIVRLFGGRDGFSLGALAKAKAEGFTAGRDTKGEAEAGVLVGYHHARFHLDANGFAGVGLGEEREMDGEAKLRTGFDVLPYLRVGIDGQARVRLLGDGKLAGDRTWDWVIGPQVLASYRNLYTAVAAGPATFGYAGAGVGFLGSVTVGATTL